MGYNQALWKVGITQLHGLDCLFTAVFSLTLLSFLTSQKRSPIAKPVAINIHVTRMSLTKSG